MARFHARLRFWRQRLAALVLGAVLPFSVALGQPAGLSAEGGLGLAVTTVPGEGTAAWGLQLHTEPRLGGLAGLRFEGGLSLFSPVCFALEEAPCAVPEETAPLRMLSGSVAASLFSPPLVFRRAGWQAAAGLYAGREAVAAWRGGRHCLNCHREGIALRGGFYAEPSLALWAGRLGLGAGLRLYHPRADLHRRVTLRLLVR